MAQPMNQTIWLTSKEENQQMMAMWPDIVRDIMKGIEDKNLKVPSVAKWTEKVLQYNVPGGKKLRAFTLIYTYKLLAPSEQLTEENIRLVRILAWCMELLQAHLLVIDDILDQSSLRRGQPCWYRCNDLGLAAINDSLILQCAMFYLIRKHFKGKECYVNLLETFHDITMETVMGECFELLTCNFGKKPNLDLFTMNQYSAIAEYKTSHYMFLLPITAAMQLAGIKDPEMFSQAKTILLKIGHLCQVQDDYLGCFGNPNVFGKDHTDIKDGKCTWLIVIALQRATPKQRKILEDCYGVSDREKIKRVKELFIELGVPDAYSTYERNAYNLIGANIQQISCDLPHELFQGLLDKIYRRTS